MTTKTEKTNRAAWQSLSPARKFKIADDAAHYSSAAGKSATVATATGPAFWGSSDAIPSGVTIQADYFPDAVKTAAAAGLIDAAKATAWIEKLESYLEK